MGTQLRGNYLYDGKSRLASSVRVNVTNAGTTRYIHDANDRATKFVGMAETPDIKMHKLALGRMLAHVRA